MIGVLYLHHAFFSELIGKYHVLDFSGFQGVVGGVVERGDGTFHQIVFFGEYQQAAVFGRAFRRREAKQQFAVFAAFRPGVDDDGGILKDLLVVAAGTEQCRKEDKACGEKFFNHAFILLLR